MTNRPPESDRAERLAVKLRENLHRRKSQARALREAGAGAGAVESELDPASDHAGAPEPLPKPASSG